VRGGPGGRRTRMLPPQLHWALQVSAPQQAEGPCRSPPPHQHGSCQATRDCGLNRTPRRRDGAPHGRDLSPVTQRRAL